MRDESLLKELPEDIEIIRTPAYDLTVLPWIFNKVGKFIAWKILIPDGEVLWMKRTVRVCLDRIEAGILMFFILRLLHIVITFLA